MTHQLGMQELLLRLLIHPFQHDKPVTFSSSLISAETVLVFLPSGLKKKETQKLFKKIDAIFTGKKLLLVCDIKDKDRYDGRVLTFDPAGTHILNLGKQPAMKILTQEAIDLFIDLCQKPGLLNLYICRRLNPAVRAGLRHPLSAKYYNLEFTPNRAKSATENALDMLTFIGTVK